MKLSRRSLLAAPAVAALAAPALAWALDPAVERARAVVHDLMGRAPIPATSVAVWRDGGLVWAEAFGLADVEARLPATPQARFRFASVSKVVTAAAAMRLVQRGVVDLDAPISRYREGLPPQHRQTTLRQLLAHQGGVRHYIGRDFDPNTPGGPIDQRTYATTRDKLAIFINDPLLSQPGEAFHYSTFSYTLAGAVLEAAAGRSLKRILSAEVFDPLALGSVEPEVRGAPVPDRVCDYQPTHSVRPLAQIHRCPPINPAYKLAGGGLLGDAPDLARFGGACTRPGFLTVESLTEMGRPLSPRKDPPTVAVGVGWRIDRDGQGRRRLHHIGSILGGRSILMVLPDHALSVAILTNLGEIDFDALTPAQQIADAFTA